MNYQKAIDHILHRLDTELADHLLYHDCAHTLDVLEASERIGKREDVSEEEMKLLLVAAAYHDCGFLVTYSDHEKAGCEIAREVLPSFGFTDSEIEQVCAMILATRVPQQPNSALERIICDADLDYLGRDDFFTIGQQLFKEWMHVGIVKDEKAFNRIQVKFLNGHFYHTEYSKGLRTPVKLAHLAQVEHIVDSYDA